MKNKNKGFTIVELIVVMAIIGVLVLIAVPTLDKYLDNAEEVDRQAALRATYAATVAYYATNPLPEEGYLNPSEGMLTEYTETDYMVVSGKKDGEPPNVSEKPEYVNKYGHFEWSSYNGADKDKLMCVHIIPEGNVYADAGFTDDNPAPTNTIIIEMYDPKDKVKDDGKEPNIAYYKFPF